MVKLEIFYNILYLMIFYIPNEQNISPLCHIQQFQVLTFVPNKKVHRNASKFVKFILESENPNMGVFFS